MKSLKSIIRALSLTLAMTFTVVCSISAFASESVSITEQRRSFLNSKCSDGITNGQRIYGKNFDPDDTSTWVYNDLAELKETLGLSEQGSVLSFPETSDGINNKVKIADLIEQEDGSCIAADGFAYLPIGGDLQFTDIDKDGYYINIESNLDARCVNLINVDSNVLLGGHTRTFYFNNDNLHISVASNCEQPFFIGYSSETGNFKARSDLSNSNEPKEDLSFVGWYNRESDTLISDNNELDLNEMAERGIFAVEARFSVKGIANKLRQIADLSSDGVINTYDAVLMLRDVAAGNYVHEDYQAYDVNSDGYINTLDAVEVLKICCRY